MDKYLITDINGRDFTDEVIGDDDLIRVLSYKLNCSTEEEIEVRIKRLQPCYEVYKEPLLGSDSVLVGIFDSLLRAQQCIIERMQKDTKEHNECYYSINLEHKEKSKVFL